MYGICVGNCLPFVKIFIPALADTCFYTVVSNPGLKTRGFSPDQTHRTKTFALVIGTSSPDFQAGLQATPKQQYSWLHLYQHHVQNHNAHT